MSINKTHVKYDISRWTKNREVCEGQDAVKNGRTRYLPDDNENDTSNEARARYDNILSRALFVPIAQRTVAGFQGSIFRKPADVKLISEIEYIAEDADGEGNSLEQFASIVTSDLQKTGRFGILVEYPKVDGTPTVEQIRQSGLAARLVKYPAESIKDWRTKKINGIVTPVMIKLYEEEEDEVSIFETKTICKYRVLSLVDGVYAQTVYNEKGEILEPTFNPKGVNGELIDTIPFVIIGAEDNTWDVGQALISGIVDVNITHYQVSADKLKNLHIHSGGLLVISSEMSGDEFAIQNPNGVRVGADQGLFVGANGSANILQLQPASQCQTEIESLEKQAIAIGARLITESTANETAEAARIHASASGANLSKLVDNASEGIEKALELLTIFMGGNPDNIFFKLNKDFFEVTVSPQELITLIQLADRGDIGQTDLRQRLRRGGLITRTDEEINADGGQL